MIVMRQVIDIEATILATVKEMMKESDAQIVCDAIANRVNDEVGGHPIVNREQVKETLAKAMRRANNNKMESK